MGITSVTVRVKSPKDETKVIEEEFLVDSGAAYFVVPKPFLDRIGVKSYREQTFALAANQRLKEKMEKKTSTDSKLAKIFSSGRNL